MNENTPVFALHNMRPWTAMWTQNIHKFLKETIPLENVWIVFLQILIILYHAESRL